MNPELIQIFNESACLSRRQMRSYLASGMSPEERHAAELHLLSCPLCSEATEGLMMQPAEAAQLMSQLNPAFIKEHFRKQLPQVHLNSMSPAVPASGHVVRRRRHNAQSRPMPRMMPLGMLLLLGLGIVWLSDWNQNRRLQQPAQHKTAVQSAPGRAQAAKPAAARLVPVSAAVTGPVSTVQPPEPDRIAGSQAAGQPEEPPRQPQSVIMADQSGAQKKPVPKEQPLLAGRAEAGKPAEPAAQAPEPGAPPALRQQTEAPEETPPAVPDKEKETVKTSTPKTEAPAATSMEQARDAYARQNWQSALRQFRQAMNSGEGGAEAKLYAARCYLNMGRPDDARPLLESLAQGSGPHKRSAKSLLRQMRRDEP